MFEFEDNAQIVGSLEDILERALERWGRMPKVISGLVMFAVQPGTKQLLLPALRWTSSAVKSFDTYDWKYGLEEMLSNFSTPAGSGRMNGFRGMSRCEHRSSRC